MKINGRWGTKSWNWLYLLAFHLYNEIPKLTRLFSSHFWWFKLKLKRIYFPLGLECWILWCGVCVNPPTAGAREEKERIHVGWNKPLKDMPTITQDLPRGPTSWRPTDRPPRESRPLAGPQQTTAMLSWRDIRSVAKMMLFVIDIVPFDF